MRKEASANGLTARSNKKPAGACSLKPFPTLTCAFTLPQQPHSLLKFTLPQQHTHFLYSHFRSSFFLPSS